MRSAPRFLFLFVLASMVAAQPTTVDYETVLRLQSPQRKVRRIARTALIEAGDRSLVPGIVDAMFFTAATRRDELLDVLIALTGVDLGRRYYDWVEWVGSQKELKPREGYAGFKADLLQRIDKRYAEVFYPGAPNRIRLEEVVWGGVSIGGIPALVNPESVRATEATYLRDDELVFGASLGGDHRAYPLRIMDWHEMLNDRLGGEPVALSYCTLCRSGILFHTRTPDGGAYVFGTSGLLYRSNKLMIDQRSLSLWSNLTGEPVIGRLARSEIRLPMLPMTLTTWRSWRGRHPDTTVLDLAPLTARYDFRYAPGAADEARTGVSFPVWRKDDRLAREAEVYAMRMGGRAKAYAVEALLAAGVLNDTVGSMSVVLVADPESGSIRAYARGERTFRRDAGGSLRDESGLVWRLTEEALLSVGDSEGAVRLERQPGHVAFWFGWYGFFPDTELWNG